MRTLNAISLAPAVQTWLTDTRHPRLLHVFDHVCNLINEHDAVLSTVSSQIGNGPFNLVIEDDALLSEYVRRESPLSIFPDRLILGDLTIQVTGTGTWEPHPDWEDLRAQRNSIFEAISSLRFSDASATHISNEATVSTSTFNFRLSLNNASSPILRVSDALGVSVSKADHAGSIAAAQKLAGLGIGLTPAGDDFMLGAIYAAWMLHPHETAQALAEAIVNTAAPLTTSLSAAWLRSAARGEAGILWHELFSALAVGDSTQTQPAIHKILAVGETSGADALAGFISTFISYMERETNHVIPKHLY